MSGRTRDRGDLFAGLPHRAEDEVVDDLVRRPGVRVERIVSTGQSSPPGFWYDQEEDEWVMVVRGRARLELRDPDETVELGPGQWLDLPAHRRHRVAWTDPDEPTIWLALFSRPG